MRGSTKQHFVGICRIIKNKSVDKAGQKRFIGNAAKQNSLLAIHDMYHFSQKCPYSIYPLRLTFLFISSQEVIQYFWVR